eukprot:12919614-Prorocentrum_lima.AAC.1
MDLVTKTMRYRMPTSDLSRMSMAKGLQMSVSRVTASLPPLGTWYEDYVDMLGFGMICGAILEPRIVLAVVKGTMET